MMAEVKQLRLPPFDLYLVHRYSHGPLILHEGCPWCYPAGERHEESPWFVLGNIKIYGPR
jgi:hypothetical protein